MSDLLTDSAIERLLERSTIARLGCHAQERTYVVPVAYAYSGGACYGHMSDGMKLRMLRANPVVCVEVEQIQSLALWDTVIAWGTFEELAGEAARDAAGLFMRRVYAVTLGNAPAAGLDRPIAMALARGVIYRIKLHEKTGRSERGDVASAWFGGAQV